MEISKTADQALLVLLHIAEHGPGNPAELGRSLDLNRTVVHRLLATLHARGFVLRRSDDRYDLGAVLARMSDRFAPALRAAAHDVMAELAARLGETVVLGVRDGSEVAIVEQATAGQLVQVRYEPGYRHPLVLGASGLALLAGLDAADRERVLAGEDSVREKLTETRRNGYAVTRDELQSGAHGLAVAVAGPGLEVVASLAVIVPAHRAAGLETYAAALHEAAARITTGLSR